MDSTLINVCLPKDWSISKWADTELSKKGSDEVINIERR